MKKIILLFCGLVLTMAFFSTVNANTEQDNSDIIDINDTQAVASNWKCIGNTDNPEKRVVISPDHKLMLTIDMYGKVKIYDYQTLKVKSMMESDQSWCPFICSAFYPNGQRVALGSNNKIVVYGMDGKALQQCDVPSKRMAFSPSGKYIVVNSGTAITILDATTLKTLGSISSCIKDSFSFFKTDTIAYLSRKGELLFYDLNTGKEADMAGSFVDKGKSLLAISDDQQLMYLGDDSNGQVLKTSDWSTLCRFKVDRNVTVDFKHNSHEIIFINGNTITTYNGESGKVLDRFQDDILVDTYDVSFDQNSNRLLLASLKGLFIMGGPSEKALTIDSGSLTPKPKLAEGTPSVWKCLYKNNTKVKHVAVSPDNQTLLSMGEDFAKVYDFSTLNLKSTIKPTTGEIKAGTFYPDGKTMALGTEKGIEVYSADGKLLRKCAVPTNILAFSPSGNYLVVQNGVTVSILDAGTLKTLHTITHFSEANDHFVFLKDDSLIYLSQNDRLIFYSLKEGKPVEHTQPTINRPASLIAISDDQQLLFVGDYQQGQVFKMDDWSTLCRFYYLTTADQVIFKHNSHEIMCFSQNKLRGLNGEISTYNAENGRHIDRFSDDKIYINHFVVDPSGKRLLIAGNGLFIMGGESEPEMKMPDLGYRPMFVIRNRAFITIDSAESRQGVKVPVYLNMKVDISNNVELHTEGNFWCKAQVSVDGEVKEVSGYISKKCVSTKRATTIDDLRAYKKVLQGSYQFKDFETIMRSPASYPKCFGEYSGELVGGDIEVHISDNGDGIPYLDINDFGQRFLVEIPSSEFADDFDALKGGGWSEGDRITLYLKFSRIGTFRNELGMVFRIPIFRALALYDEYRVIYLKK